MSNHRRHATWLIGMTILAVSAGLVAADRHQRSAAARMDASKRALHALNRLTFGPRPGDVERVTAMGVDKWIEAQLHPEKIDDAALQARVSGFRTLKMDARTIVENFPPPQVLRAVANGRQALPQDPQQRAVYEDAVARYRAREQQKSEGQVKGNKAGEDAAAATPADQPPGAMDEQQRRQLREARRAAREQAQAILSLPPDQRMQAILKVAPEERRSLAQVLTTQDRNQLVQDFTPEQLETLRAMVNPQSVVVTELQQAKILRAAYSERQLEEVMADFWFNHFNVFLNKGADRYLTTAYERDVIRPHALGKFRDLLVATAQSPAMMFYLDNWQSVGPRSTLAEMGPRLAQFRARRAPGADAEAAGDQPAAPAPRRPAGLNENYGRELMELHTLGVDGGYTQKDVTEVAKVFTGWTIRQPRLGGDFAYNPRMHEPGPKYVLGQEIKDDGEAEGRKVLDALARHPATAKFICRKLAMRFVSDNPPPALVDRMADTFLKTDGDIREVLRTLFRSPEFWAPDTYRAKVKTPLEFVVSAIRAAGVDVENAMPFVQTLNQMGMPLYQMQPPTGYSMKAETWVNSAALLGRMNFALRLASGRVPGSSFDPARLLAAAPSADDPQAVLAAMENSLLAGDVSRQTHAAILKQLEDPQAVAQQMNAQPTNAQPMNSGAQPQGGAFRNTAGGVQPPQRVNLIAGLILGSPEFQRR